MIDIEKVKKEIVERLKPLKPEKIILFGSYALGNPTEDSDIDLITHTIPMHHKFIELDSMFSRQIIRDGVSLL